MRARLNESPEGIPWRDYAWRELAAAVPVGGSVAVAFELLRASTREVRAGVSRVPNDAIVYMFHEDLAISMFAPRFWHDLGPEFSYLGFHGFASYVAAPWAWAHGFRAHRFDRRRAEPPMDQVRRYLQERPRGPFALRTDAGGPYGRVRPSLVTLALGTARPLVAARQLADRATKVRGHWVPLPGARITTHVSEPIEARVLAALTPAEARDLLQREIDALTPT